MQLMPGRHFLKQNWAFSEDFIFEVTVVLFQEHQIKIVLQTLAASILLEVWDLQDSYDIVASLITNDDIDDTIPGFLQNLKVGI